MIFASPKRMKTVLLFLLLALNLYVTPATAAPLCLALFGDSKVVEVHGRAKTDPNIAWSNRVAKFGKAKADLETAIASLSPYQQRSLKALLHAIEFFDSEHMSEALLKNFFKDHHRALNFSRLYDEGENNSPFKNFLATRKYLETNKPAPTVETFYLIQSLMMAKGIEELTYRERGTARRQAVEGLFPSGFGVTLEGYQNLYNNSYLLPNLQFEKANIKTAPSLTGLKIWMSELEPLVQSRVESAYVGSVMYPDPIQSPIQVVQLIEKSQPDLFKKITDARQQGKDISPADYGLFIDGLTRERFKRFERERALLGPIQVGQNDAQFVDLVADLQRDLISIHPTTNGNGRSGRAFANYLLTREGLPPMRLANPDLDLLSTPNEWREQVRQSLITTTRLYADLAYRIKNGLDVMESPELLAPGIPEVMPISQFKPSRKKTPQYRLAKVDAEQFPAFLKALVALEPRLKNDLKSDRLRTMNRIIELFVEFQSSKTIDYLHAKDGEKEIRLRFVSEEFMDTFSQIRSFDPTLWSAKISRWYNQKMLVWRGLADLDRVIEDKELLDQFRTPSTHLASNNVVQKAGSKANLARLMRKDFIQYNKDLLTGRLIEMAIDHHTTGPLYDESYGLSTSKREVVGKAFAMGAMVVSKYGEQNDPAVQATIKSRINIAMYPAQKDVDLGRLRGFNSDFAYKYGRQAEVMAIGGVDPDSVMLIQRLDAAGKVTTTFYRNPDQPNEIFEIKGRFVPSEGPLDLSMVVARHQLFDSAQSRLLAQEVVPLGLSKNRNSEEIVSLED